MASKNKNKAASKTAQKKPSTSACSNGAAFLNRGKASISSSGEVGQLKQPKSPLPQQDVAKFGSDTPMKRPAQPEEIAPAFVFFASEIDSSYVTGKVLTLLGGETTAG